MIGSPAGGSGLASTAPSPTRPTSRRSGPTTRCSDWTGTCYPATMVSPGDRDATTVPMHAYKYVAALQHAQGCDRPVLLRVSWGAGHSAGAHARGIDRNLDRSARVSGAGPAATLAVRPRRGWPQTDSSASAETAPERRAASPSSPACRCPAPARRPPAGATTSARPAPPARCSRTPAAPPPDARSA